MDSIAGVGPEYAGPVVVTGSHGGASSGEYAVRQPLLAVYFNDAEVRIKADWFMASPREPRLT